MESNRHQNLMFFSSSGSSPSGADKKDIPLMNQYSQYLVGLLNETNLSVSKQDKNLYFECSDNDKLKKLLDEMGIKYLEKGNGINVDEKSMNDHMKDSKKQLVYLAVYLYSQAVGNLNTVFDEITQKASETYKEDLERRQKLLNKIFNLVVFEYKAHGLDDRFPEMNYHDMLGIFLNNHLLSLLKDKNLNALIAENTEAKQQTASSDPGPSIHHPRSNQQKASMSDSGAVIKRRTEGTKGPSIQDVFFSQFFNLNIKNFTIPSGEVLARLRLRYPISIEDEKRINKVVSIFMIKDMTDTTSAYLQHFSPEAKQLLDSLIDQEGNCKLTLQNLGKLCELMLKNVQANEPVRKSTP